MDMIKTVCLVSIPKDEKWEARHLNVEFDAKEMWSDWESVENGDEYHDDWEYRQVNKSNWVEDYIDCFANKPQARELLSSFCNRVLNGLIGTFNYEDVKSEFIKLGVKL